MPQTRFATTTERGVDGWAAAMLQYDDGESRVLRTWPYSDRPKHAHFAALLARGAVCADGSSR